MNKGNEQLAQERRTEMRKLKRLKRSEGEEGVLNLCKIVSKELNNESLGKERVQDLKMKRKGTACKEV